MQTLVVLVIIRDGACRPKCITGIAEHACSADMNILLTAFVAWLM